ncbi:MAG: flagellar biosynthesis protein FlhB [Alicyclobacillus sp.]|nr:flagellar biosynthesis protein FlhB [Alicyclobacillus sp.]
MMLEWNLQRFAADKTEPATPKRREQARKEGHIPRSPELTSAVGLLSGILALRLYGSHVWVQWYNTMIANLQFGHLKPLTVRQVGSIMFQLITVAATCLSPIVLAMTLFGVLTAYRQVGTYFMPSRLLPDFSRINMMAGLRRLFGIQSVVETGKSLVKLLIIAIFSYSAVQEVVDRLSNFVSLDLWTLPSVVGGMVFHLAIRIALGMLALALADWAFQRFRFEQSIRMSRQEVKDEMRQQEGSPEIRGRIRQRGRALAMQRMMQQVPTADVVITNPTHYAVALKYEATMSAPKVVAKGQDLVARRIRELAVRHEVPVIENKPLAQTLYRTVEVGESIPVDLYQAVAEVLAYVYRLRQGPR